MNENKDKVALFILKALKEEGIHHIFFVPGFVIDSFLPNFSKADIRPIVAAHEGGAAYMADGYSRASQNFGVCMGVGGPGITNMITAVSAAYGDRSPVLIIGGRIRSDWEAKGVFQDSSTIGIDDIAIMRPITEFAITVPRSDVTDRFLRKAIRVIRDVESLPVFLSIPEDVQKAECEKLRYVSPHSEPYRIVDTNAAMKVLKLLAEATRIAIFAGNGIICSNANNPKKDNGSTKASEYLQKFAEKYNIPVVTTMRAKGAIPEDSDMSFGVFGFGGSLRANKVILGSQNPCIPKTEVLLVLGATLNENNTFIHHDEFPPSKHLILVDINPNINRDMEYDHTFVMADILAFLEWMEKNSGLYHDKLKESKAWCKRKEWTDAIKKTEEYDTPNDRKSSKKPIHPARAITDLRDVVPRHSVLVVDSGAHTFFTGHHWKSYGPNEFLFLSTTGPMGYGIAMGIGAQLARPKKPCICVVGDGSMLMHGMELRTAVKQKIPLIVVVINNGALGNVYLRFQKAKQKEQKEAAELAKIEPRQDWASFAESLGAEAIRVEEPSKLVEEYAKAFKHSEKNAGPYLVDVICNNEFPTPNYKKPKGEGKVVGVRALRATEGEEQAYLPHW
jgi:acetolactate synthase-1/2/3 large subunit